MDNPFVTKGYAGAEYFCDRVRETEQLVELTTNGNNIALISPRRVGKTDLIRHYLSQPQIRDRYYTFHIDIYATASIRDFVNAFGRAILEELKPKGKIAWGGFLSVLRSLKSEVTYDSNNFPTWSVGLGDIEHPETTLDEIFYYLSHADKPCIVAIDEFQQIIYYSDAPSIEATLRTYIQKCTNATFIFSGSKRHLMGEIFTSSARPFYQSVMIMNLAPIAMDKYTEFAMMQFSKFGKQIEAQAVEDTYNRFDGVTSCMQRVLNVLFLKTPQGQTCTQEMVDSAIDYILDMFNETFADILEKLPLKQREVFIAIAREGKAKAINSKVFIKKHHLQTASVVNAAMRGLLDKDFVTEERGTYTVYDPFYALWLQRNI